MSNDRLLLVCKTCGGFLPIMSHYPGDLSAGDTTRLKGWLNGHAQCNSHYFDDDLAGESHLLIVTEAYAPNLDISKQGYLPKYEI